MQKSAHQQFSEHSIIIMAAPNGARRTRADHPAIPLSPDELATEARNLLEAGVSVLHLHVRDRYGKHTIEPAAYRAAISAIRKHAGNDLVIQVTSESVGRYLPSEQMAMVRQLRPEAVSLALGEVCADESREEEFAKFCEWMRQDGTWPQYILYSPAELVRFDRLRRQGLFADPSPFVLFVLGNYLDERQGHSGELHEFLKSADCSQFPWAACSFGPGECEVMLEAGRLGGHVRLGFENNIQMPDGSIAADNPALIRSFLQAGRPSDRAIARPSKIRREFCLKRH